MQMLIWSERLPAEDQKLPTLPAARQFIPGGSSGEFDRNSDPPNAVNQTL
jgi:hypothetical protein